MIANHKLIIDLKNKFLVKTRCVIKSQNLKLIFNCDHCRLSSEWRTCMTVSTFEQSRKLTNSRQNWKSQYKVTAWIKKCLLWDLRFSSDSSSIAISWAIEHGWSWVDVFFGTARKATFSFGNTGRSSLIWRNETFVNVTPAGSFCKIIFSISWRGISA